MKIIQEGHPERVKKATCRFVCYDCGCIFEAERNEYTDIYALFFSAEMSCPCCGIRCYGKRVKE